MRWYKPSGITGAHDRHYRQAGGFIAALGLDALAVFILTVVVRLTGQTHLANATDLNARYANTGLIGFPWLRWR